MNTYYYRLLTDEGDIRSGFTRLAFEKDYSARLWLERRYQGVVLVLRRMPTWMSNMPGIGSGMLKGSVRADDISAFLRDLGIMLQSGVPMLDALRSIAEESEYAGETRAGQIAATLLGDLEAGASVSDAFARHPDIFPESVRNLVIIGDETGAMEKMLIEGAEHIARLSSMGRDVRRAMIYPAFVFSAIIAAAAFWVVYVIPNLSALFAQMHAELPVITKAVLMVSDVFSKHAFTAGAITILLIVAIWLGVRLSGGFRLWMHRLAHRAPISRVIVRSSGMAFITEHMALLITAGLDLVRSLRILERSISDELYRQKIRQVRGVVERGERLAAAMRQVKGFPPMAVRMISVGEETGSLDDQLRHLAHEYRQRLDHVIASLSEIIKPAVILLAGLLFLLLVVALLLPVYDLVKQSVGMQG